MKTDSDSGNDITPTYKLQLLQKAWSLDKTALNRVDKITSL